MNKHSKYFLFLSFVNIFFTLFVVLNKYTHNGLSISEFNIFVIGNLIELGLFLLFFVLLFILWKTPSIHVGHFRTLALISIFIIIPLIVVFILNTVNFQFEALYLFGYPLRKILPALLYLISFISYLLTILIFIYLIKGRKIYSYIYSVVTLLILIFFIILLPFTWSILNKNSDGNNLKGDIGVILGAAVYRNNNPSPIFIARIEKGASLLKQKRVKKLYLTGGNAPGEISEALSAKNYLIENFNINNSDLVIEELTATTNEQIRYFKKLYSSLNYKPNIIFISDDFHLLRIKEMVKFYNFDAKVIPSGYNLNYKKSLYYRFRDSISLLLFWLFGI